jgi:RHS repeat-associated protein
VRPGTGGTETVAYAYDRADRIRSAGDATFTVDANGNITSRTTPLATETFTYDQANRLTGVSIAGVPVMTYAYDGDGNRRSAGVVVGLGNTIDVNRPLPVVLSETGTQLSYVWGHGSTHAQSASVTVEGRPIQQLDVYHADGLGSVRAVTNGDGTVIQTYRTDEFGVPILADSLGTSLQPFQYAGEQRDLVTSFVYLRARYYAPEIGRFMGRDPFAGLTPSPQSLNRYSYARNNPTSYRDPSGLCEDPGGPGVRFCIERFIRQGSVGMIFAGDNRGPDSNGGTYRLRQFIWLDPFRESHVAGQTIVLGGIYRGPGVIETCTAKKSKVLAGNVVNTVCAATIGFLPFLAPPLGYHLEIVDTGSAAFVRQFFGTGFPAIEVWRYEGLGTEPQPVFYDPGSDRPLDLYDPRLIFEPAGGGGGELAP